MPDKRQPTEERAVFAGLPVLWVRKRVKRITLSVLPPYGAIRVTTPLCCPRAELERVVLSRRAWLREKVAEFPPDPGRERRYESGESVLLWGDQVPLIPRIGRSGAAIAPAGLVLSCPSDEPQRREAALLGFYRAETARRADEMLPALSGLTGLAPKGISVRKMKRRWGTCFPKRGLIHLNLSLAAFPPACLEYVLLHKLLHLRHPDHGPGFHAELDRLMPDHRARQETLKRFSRLAPTAWLTE